MMVHFILETGMLSLSFQYQIQIWLIRSMYSSSLSMLDFVASIIWKYMAFILVLVIICSASILTPLFLSFLSSCSNLQNQTPVSLSPKYKKSPTRRSKSRWEPLSEKKSVEKLGSFNNYAAKYSSWVHVNEKDRKVLFKSITFVFDINTMPELIHSFLHNGSVITLGLNS